MPTERRTTRHGLRLGPPAVDAHRARHGRTGFALGLSACALWGILPLYFKALERVLAVDIVAHRVLWSLPVLAALIGVSRGWGPVRRAIREKRTIGILL